MDTFYLSVYVNCGIIAVFCSVESARSVSRSLTLHVYMSTTYYIHMQALCEPEQCGCDEYIS